MARRVKQADGSYCYTENCRIHDRGLNDATGFNAVIADIDASNRNTTMDFTAKELKSITDCDTSVAEDAAASILKKVNGRADMSRVGHVADYIKVEMVSRGLTAPGEKVDALAYNLTYSIQKSTFVGPGDEVILKETGERGEIVEGSSFGGKVRFSSQKSNSRNNFAWFNPEQVAKVNYDDDTAPARQRIVATRSDNLIPTSIIRQLFVQETSEGGNNPQAVKAFGRHKAIAQRELQEFGEALHNRYKDRGMTKGRLLSAMHKEYQRPLEGKTPAQVRAIKGGLRNIIDYLEAEKR